MPTFDEFYASLNPDSGTRGNEFEQKFVPWFLQTDPEWKSQIDQLWLWKDYPHRWGRDCGIDLVFRDTNGRDWAVQAKCLNPDSYITKKHIDSFFSESSDKHIHGRLLIATTDRIGRNAKQVIERQEKQVVLFLLDHFRKSAVQFPASLQTLLQGKRRDPRKPLPHQKRAIRDVVSGLSDAARGQLIMACGTGKTLTSLWVKENLECAVTLVLVPSLNLLSQTLREWTANARVHFKWLCVCSDSTVANQDDEWLTHTSDIGVPVTGDLNEIKSFLRTEGSKVIFSTYHSSPLIAEVQKDQTIPAFDLVLADEAHRCAGKVSEAFGCVLDPKRIRTGKLLFMTATPRILSRQTKSAAEGMNVEVVSMDDPAVFGDVLHELKFSQAIEKGLLSDYRVVIIVVDNPLLKSQIQNRVLLRTSNGIELDAQTLASHIALAKATKQHNLRRVISFHGRVSDAKQFAADHTEVLGWIRKAERPSGTTTADYVSGNMSSGDRNTKLNRLRHLESDERAILCNARCLSEGVDVPSLDGVAFISARRSQVDIVQAVGRAIRKSDGKTHGTIVIPVFIEEGESEHEALESSRFKPIWDVVNALKSHDDALAHDLDQLRTSLGRSGVIGSRGLQKIVFDLPTLCGQSFVDGLRTRLVEHTTASWLFWYGLLQEYVNENGSARPEPTYKTKAGFKLGQWVGTQRRTKDSLSAERRSLLESCKGWSWSPLDDRWDEAFEELQQYVKANGSARPPKDFKTKDGFALGTWVSGQRSKKDSLSEKRRRLLESCNGWSWDPLADQWDEGFASLVEYVQTNGSARVRQNFRTKDGFKLGQWASDQRKHKSRLSLERQKLLESCRGWCWDAFADKWLDGFEELKKIVALRGSIRVSKSHKTPGGKNLGFWIFNQRRKKDSLTSEQVRLLESVDGWTWEPVDRWDEAFRKFFQYAEMTGSARIPAGFKTEDGFDLRAWVTTQRRSRASLSTKQRKLLESCKGWSWDPLADQWDEAFQRLKQYVGTHGSAIVPQRYKTEDGFPLGNWASSQRSKRDVLSAEQKHSLESLFGWCWDPQRDHWAKKFSLFIDHVRNTGSARVPSHFITDDGFALGSWVRDQVIHKDSLSEERRSLLESSCHDWTWSLLEDEWIDGLKHLQEFAKKTGSAKPKQSFRTASGFHLGKWVSDQRKNRDELSSEQRALLESCDGWSWDRFVEQWEQAFARLQEYVEKTGTSRVPKRFKTKDGFALGMWVGNQRTFKDVLSADRRRLLESVAGWTWNSLEEQWEEGLKQLEQYVSETGTAKVPQRFKTNEGFALGQWVATQRKARSSLSADRKRRLTMLDGWAWDARS